MRASWMILGFLALTSLAAQSGACRGDFSEEPPIHLNPNMDQQKRFDPQEPSSHFPDGLATRKPVPGTVAQGQLRTDTHLHQGRTAEGFATALPPSIPMDARFLARGRERFGIFCGTCHGPLGRGDGLVYQRDLGLPRPADLQDDRLRAMPIGEVVHTIALGKQNMQRMGPQIPATDRWAIAAYVRALQISQAPPAGLREKVQP